MSPCTNCRKSGDSCVVSVESRKCASCVKRGYSCDVRGPSSRDFEKIAKEKERLRLEEAAAEKAEEMAFRAQMEARARRDRVRRQAAFLSGREGELLRRGLETVEELEKAEEEDRKVAEVAAEVLSTPTDLDLESLDPESWPDPFADILATTAGS